MTRTRSRRYTGTKRDTKFLRALVTALTRYILPASQNKATFGRESKNRHNKMSWWSSMVSAISGNGETDDEPQLPPNTCLSPPHPHGHMPTSLTSSNEFRASPTPQEGSSPSDSSASASAGYWSLSSLTNSLAATSSSLTEVYKVRWSPLHNLTLRNIMVPQRDILSFASTLTEEVRSHCDCCSLVQVYETGQVARC